MPWDFKVKRSCTFSNLEVVSELGVFPAQAFYPFLDVHKSSSTERNFPLHWLKSNIMWDDGS